MSKYESMEDGEAATLIYRQAKKQKGAVIRLCCCDCGLTHRIVIIPMKTRLKMYLWRDKRATANIRRSKEKFLKR